MDRNLPGRLLIIPDNQYPICANHSDRTAKHRIIIAADSFGSEVEDLCQECYDEHRKAVESADSSGVCDWCKQSADVLHSHRDIEEGSCGRVYDVCSVCIDAERARWREDDDF